MESFQFCKSNIRIGAHASLLQCPNEATHEADQHEVDQDPRVVTISNVMEMGGQSMALS